MQALGDLVMATDGGVFEQVVSHMAQVTQLPLFHLNNSSPAANVRPQLHGEAGSAPGDGGLAGGLQG